MEEGSPEEPSNRDKSWFRVVRGQSAVSLTTEAGSQKGGIEEVTLRLISVATSRGKIKIWNSNEMGSLRLEFPFEAQILMEKKNNLNQLSCLATS